MNLIFFGPPGGGKGTQARLLEARHGLRQVATGDILREAVAAENPLGREARQYMEAGDLVPDSVMIAIVEERLRRSDVAAGFILDGFPRTRPQAEALEGTLDRLERRLDHVVDFQVSAGELIRRLSGRRVCQAAGHIYHLESKPPRVAGVCDLDGSPLRQREDDRPQTIRRRMEVHRVQTAPVLDFYRGRHIYMTLNAEGTVEDVHARLAAALGLS